MTYVVSFDFCTTNDAAKPELPYSIGSKHVLRAHRAALPDYRDDRLPYTDHARETRQLQHPVEGCRMNPPASGLPSKTHYSLTIQVIKRIRVKDNASAQLVLVEVLSNSSSDHDGLAPSAGSRLLAKFYDPLYNHYQDDINPFLAADRDYKYESAAYQHLRELQGRYIPRFFGSYSATILTPFDRTMLGTQQDFPGVWCNGPCERQVRCILIEYIHGTVLQDLSNEISEDLSKAIMKGIVDAESQMWRLNSIHHDLFPRNVLVRGLGKVDVQIFLIDFGYTEIGRRTMDWGTDKDEAEHLPGVYISPLLRWHSAWHKRFKKPEQFAPWIKWDWQSWLDETYGHHRPSITPEMKEIYLPDEVLNKARDYWQDDPKTRTRKARAALRAMTG